MINYNNCEKATYLPTFFDDGHPTISKEEIDAYIDLKPEVVDATVCINNPLVDTLTALWYVFDDTTVTIGDKFFGYITFK